MVVTAIQYNEIENQTQQVLYDIISADTNVATLTSLILDGTAVTLSRQGFPRIIIHTPNIDEERITMTKFKVIGGELHYKNQDEYIAVELDDTDNLIWIAEKLNKQHEAEQ